MSLHMQHGKKKAQEEMRRLMAERKKKDLPITKINNPLAKYNGAGQLMCILCSSVVRSENVWQVHVNSKQHRSNVEQAKKLKELTNNFTNGKIKQKRQSITLVEVPPEKKIKSILKNAIEKPSIVMEKPKTSVSGSVPFHNEEIKRAPLNYAILSKNTDNTDELSKKPSSSSELLKQEVKSESLVSDQPIPEGFFDDPILDAKVRNIEYKNPEEEEWEKFQKEIKEEASASAEIIAGEQEEATAERQIDEIDEQIRNWSRVLDLELKKEETKKKTQESEQMSEGEVDEDDDGDDIDEFLDWRAKKSFS